MDENQVAEQVLEMLSGSKFERWYETTYTDFIEGADNAKSKEEIIEDVKRLLKK